MALGAVREADDSAGLCVGKTQEVGHRPLLAAASSHSTALLTPNGGRPGGSQRPVDSQTTRLAC